MQRDNNNLGVFGVPQFSPYQITTALRELGLTHRVVGFAQSIKEVVIAFEQPAMIYVVDSLHNAKLVNKKSTMPFVVFASVSEDQLALTNVPILKGDNLKGLLRNTLMTCHPENPNRFTLHEEVKGLDSYVDEATNPTFLYYIQTAIYKLTPYDLVREARTLIVSALYGAIPMKKLYAFLGTSLKLEDLKTLLKDDRAKKVRETVIEVRKRIAQESGSGKREDEIVQKVLTGTGLDAFDILYVIRSYQKMERDRLSGKRRGRPPKNAPKQKAKR